jgi:hypothetical protein
MPRDEKINELSSAFALVSEKPTLACPLLVSGQLVSFSCLASTRIQI